MPLYLITGNEKKYREAKLLIPELEMLIIDLPEIQSADPKAVVAAKLHEARKHHAGDLLVEDTSLHFDCLGGLPGPFIKWFLETLKPTGLHALASSMHDTKAQARTIIGYAKADGGILFFEGVTHGSIVAPRTDAIFGWDPIFLPDGHTKTYAEMTKEEKNAISHRGKAVRALVAHLNGQ
jgi:inosine triphosphate pyrophosphatase